jgi:hypothetical protein
MHWRQQLPHSQSPDNQESDAVAQPNLTQGTQLTQPDKALPEYAGLCTVVLYANLTQPDLN